MKEFIANYGKRIVGVLSGWDRLVLRGSLRKISYVGGMLGYLWAKQIRLCEFRGHVKEMSERLKQASVAAAERSGRPVQYLASSSTNKEEVAREIAQRDGIKQGLICVLSCVEPCWSYDVYRNGKSQKLELVQRMRKCLFLYHYWKDAEWGWMQARIQTWFPFAIQVCLNGRERLVQQMKQAGLRYVRQDNCVVWVEDYAAAQQLLQAQLRTRWPEQLRKVARALNPEHVAMFRELPMEYYWSAHQSECASDVSFPNDGELERMYPRWVRHSMENGSGAVMRFLAAKGLTQSGGVHGNFQDEVVSDLRRRVEGIRVKHWVGQNSVKMYDKAHTPQGSVLRVETTLNDASAFRVWRRAEGQPEAPRQWHPLRKGLADLGRRAEVSQKANDRYLTALAAVDDSRTVEECAGELERPVIRAGKRFRALHPLGQDLPLLEAISDGAFLVQGLRNRDLQARLFGEQPCTPEQARRRSARVSRLLRLLRAHGLLRKVPRSHRYQVTPHAQRLLSVVLAVRHVTCNSLLAKAA
jgi:hypothetical protein